MTFKSRFEAGPRGHAKRPFTDRRSVFIEFRRRIEQAEERALHSSAFPQVLNLYGVGGIGKSRLQRELEKLAKAEFDAVTARVDFQVPALRQHDAAIYQLAHALRKQGLKFPRFDIAYASYWRRTHPQHPLTAAELPLLAESDILGEIVGIAGQLPVGGFVGRTLQAIDKLGRHAARWRRVRQDEDLRALDELDPHELLDALTFFFAGDLIYSLGSDGRTCVLFFDAHEALQGSVEGRTARGPSDGWLRDLAGQLGGVVHVVGGRFALDWEQVDPEWSNGCLRVVQVDDLCRADALSFLADCGINGETASAIAAASMGVPFYLNLAVDHYDEIAGSRDPQPSDFRFTREEIVDRFIGHLPPDYQELLTVLSIPRFWTDPLFKAMVRDLQLPVPLTRWDDLCGQSFTSRDENGAWQMHQLMRGHLIPRMGGELAREVHRTIYAYYRDLIDGDATVALDDLPDLLREAVFHGLRARTLDVGWLHRHLYVLVDRGVVDPVLTIVREIERGPSEDLRVAATGDSAALVALSTFIQGFIMQRKGDLAGALTRYEHVDLEHLPGCGLSIRFQMANAHRESGQLEAAGEVYRALWETQPTEEDRDVHWLIGIQFGDFHYVQGRFVDASTILQPLADLDPDVHAKPVAEAIRIQGHIARFSVLPEQAYERYAVARELFAKVGDEFGEARATTNLAEVSWYISPSETMAVCGRAEAMNAALGAKLEVGKALNARAAASLLLNDGATAVATASRALSIQEEVGYIGGVGQAYLMRAFAQSQLGDVDAAVADCWEAISAFGRMRGYPTLVILAMLLIQKQGRPVDVATLAEAERVVQWPDPTGRGRLDDLLQMLT